MYVKHKSLLQLQRLPPNDQNYKYNSNTNDNLQCVNSLGELARQLLPPSGQCNNKCKKAPSGGHISSVAFVSYGKIQIGAAT